MTIEKRLLIILTLGLISIIALTASVAAFFYIQYEEQKKISDQYRKLIREYENVTMRVNICINYGNGTIEWYNDTLVPLDCDLLQATQLVALVNYTYWETYKTCFVNAINGVWNTDTWFWMWFIWNAEKQEWTYGQVGADTYILSKGETVMWRYEALGG